MDVQNTNRGFQIVAFIDANGEACSMQQSSAIGEEDDAIDNPGSSMLWLGINRVQPQSWPPWKDVPLPADCTSSGRMHLTRNQVKELVAHLRRWVRTGSLDV